MIIRTLLVAALLASGTLAIAGCASNEHQRSAGTYIDDASVTTRVKTALLTEKDLNSFDISVETFEGSVQLSGFVNSQWQIDRAGQVAAAVNGVRNVRNNLIHKTN